MFVFVAFFILAVVIAIWPNDARATLCDPLPFEDLFISFSVLFSEFDYLMLEDALMRLLLRKILQPKKSPNPICEIV